MQHQVHILSVFDRISFKYWLFVPQTGLTQRQDNSLLLLQVIVMLNSFCSTITTQIWLSNARSIVGVYLLVRYEHDVQDAINILWTAYSCLGISTAFSLPDLIIILLFQVTSFKESFFFIKVHINCQSLTNWVGLLCFWHWKARFVLLLCCRRNSTWQWPVEEVMSCPAFEAIQRILIASCKSCSYLTRRYTKNVVTYTAAIIIFFLLRIVSSSWYHNIVSVWWRISIKVIIVFTTFICHLGVVVIIW
jgi:hypothetical protein